MLWPASYPPFPRAVFAEPLEKIHAQKPKVAILDLYVANDSVSLTMSTNGVKYRYRNFHSTLQCYTVSAGSEHENQSLICVRGRVSGRRNFEFAGEPLVRTDCNGLVDILQSHVLFPDPLGPMSTTSESFGILMCIQD